MPTSWKPRIDPAHPITRVFISYARKDLELIRPLLDGLALCGYEVLRDEHEILPAEAWRPRLKQLIEIADIVAFFLSPRSVASEVCTWEVEIAERMTKRIVPIVVESTQGRPPGGVGDINYLDVTLLPDNETAIRAIVAAFQTDIGWVREHARLGVRARHWDGNNRPTGALLRGQELAQAQSWLAAGAHDSHAIAVTPLHRSYLDASAAEARFERDYSLRSEARRKIILLISGFATILLALRAARWMKWI